ncbi:MAG: hypothetical protein R3B45_12205 [Bdellovibrionota bacterium]
MKFGKNLIAISAFVVGACSSDPTIDNSNTKSHDATTNIPTSIQAKLFDYALSTALEDIYSMSRTKPHVLKQLGSSFCWVNKIKDNYIKLLEDNEIRKEAAEQNLTMDSYQLVKKESKNFSKLAEICKDLTLSDEEVVIAKDTVTKVYRNTEDPIGIAANSLPQRKYVVKIQQNADRVGIAGSSLKSRGFSNLPLNYHASTYANIAFSSFNTLSSLAHTQARTAVQEEKLCKTAKMSKLAYEALKIRAIIETIKPWETGRELLDYFNSTYKPIVEITNLCDANDLDNVRLLELTKTIDMTFNGIFGVPEIIH